MAEEMKEKPIVRVKDVMEKVFVSVTPDIPIRDVFRIFIKHRLLAVLRPGASAFPPGTAGSRRQHELRHHR